MKETLISFYKEMYGLDDVCAARIGAFVEEFKNCDLLQTTTPWCKHGKARVYLEFNSQNRFYAFKPAFKIYYDANENDIFVYTSDNTFGLVKFSRLKSFGNSYFSGAKTRKEIFYFMDKFYAKKDDWNQHA